MFDNSICKKTGRAISEASSGLAQKSTGNWDDSVYESFQNYVHFCSQQCQEVESIVKEISRVYDELNDLRAETVISEAESCYSKVGKRNG